MKRSVFLTVIIAVAIAVNARQKQSWPVSNNVETTSQSYQQENCQ